MSDLSIENIDKLLNKIDKLGGNSTSILKKSVNKQINFVKGEAKLLCPVDSGRLKNSITGVVKDTSTGISGTVSTNVEYAPYVEFGTGQKGENSPSPPKYEGELGYRSDWNGQPAQPFIYPALKNNEEKVIKSVKEELKKEIRRIARK